MNSLDLIEALARLVVSQCEQNRQLLLQTELSEVTKQQLRSEARQQLRKLDLILRTTELLFLHELNQGMEMVSLLQSSETELLEVAKTHLPARVDSLKVEPHYVFAAQLMGLESEVDEAKQKVSTKVAELRELVLNMERLLSLLP